MRRIVVTVLAAVVLAFCVADAVNAESGNHYINGVEGIKAASIPPPGLYLRNYVAYYQADKMMGPNGNEVPIDFDVGVFALVPRLIWVSDKELLGANVGADALIGLIYTDIEVTAPGAPPEANVNDDGLGFYDVYVEPLLLAWHGPRYDAGFGLSVFIPVGDTGGHADPGKDYWTGMLTLGATLYLDEEKTWSASILGRYETHSERDSDKVTLGDDFHCEWGIGKTLDKVWDVGVAGYAQWQVTDDDGTNLGYDPKDHDQVYAVGPEVSTFCPKTKMFASLRSVFEFDAEDRSEGNITTLTLTKIF